MLLRAVLLFILTFANCLGQIIAAAPVKLLPPNAISKKLNDKKIIVLDVRSPEEYKTGHLENAILINAYDPDFKKKIKKLSKNKKYIVYCHSGRRSHFAADFMKESGFLHLIDMKGGITSWKNAGFKIIK